MASMSQSTLSLPVSCLHGDDAGLFRVLVLGNSSRVTKKTAKRLALSLRLKSYLLQGAADNAGRVAAPSSQSWRTKSSWVVHGRADATEIIEDALNAATDVIWLDTPFLSGTGKLGQKMIARFLQEPVIKLSSTSSKLSPSSTRTSTSTLGYSRMQRSDTRSYVKAAYAEDKNQRRWRHFAGWSGRGELREWLKQLPPSPEEERERQLSAEHHYKISAGEYCPVAIVLF